MALGNRRTDRPACLKQFIILNRLGIFKQAISARERALCQPTVCFEFQSRSDRTTQKLCPQNGVQNESKKVTVKV